MKMNETACNQTMSTNESAVCDSEYTKLFLVKQLN